jgi:integrase
VKRAADWPRYMNTRRLAGGRLAYYWIPSRRDRMAGCPLAPEALGSDFDAAAARARFLNLHLDAWRENRDIPSALRSDARVGTIDWWIEAFCRSEAVTRLASRTQRDYREVLATIADLPTTMREAGTGAPVRTGSLPVSSLSPAAVDKIYARLRRGGAVRRQADYAIDVARRAWTVVRRQHPGLFLVPVGGADGTAQRLAINPFAEVVRTPYERDTAAPVTRDEALAFARAAAGAGHPAIGVAALVCYEWLQRPEDVREGRITWTDYRPSQRPAEVLIFHHKTGQRVWQPLEAAVEHEETGTLETRRLYPELEDMLAALPRLGVPIVMFRPVRGLRTPRLYSESYAQHLVQRIRAAAGLGAHVTLEGCRHGGMTELGDAELPEQLVMALSGHVTPAAARLYVKRTERQRLAAAIRRRAYVERTKKG